MADGILAVKSKKAPAAAPDGMCVNGKFVVGAFALQVRGDSMVAPAGQWPTFPHDCMIIVDPNRKAGPGYPVLVEFQDGRTTFRMLELDGPHKCLKPLNPIYHTQPMPDDARIAGVVVQVQIHTFTDAAEEVSRAHS